MQENLEIKSSKVLIVEGLDECNFFEVLLKSLEIKDVQMINAGGSEKFATEFPAVYLATGFSQIGRLGFVRDAEDNRAECAFESLCNVLKKHELPAPAKINFVDKTANPQIGIFIMPDNQNTGMLETLCLQTLQDLPINQCVDAYINCTSLHRTEATNIPETENAKFNEPKARVQTYLASCVPIRNSLGLGAKKGYWNLEHSCFDGIKNFLKELFS
jgi:hypothetical protein